MTLLALLACTPVSIDVDDTAATEAPDLTDEVYALDHLLVVDIELSEADWDTLRHQTRTVESTIGQEDCQAQPFESPFTWFEAAVTVDGQRFDRVEVRKKGFLGSMNTEKPSLKVDLGEFQDLDYKGQRRLTLNNSVSDPSFVRQCLSYLAYADAGLPAPRCNLAHVTVNGQDLGVFVNVEPIKKPMLKRHFDDGDGNLYEGTLSDFRDGWTGTLEKKNNESQDDWSDIDALVDAASAPDDELLDALDGTLDLQQFVDFWAMEVLVQHGDGYAGNTNNFYLYADPADGRFDFIPWGVDGTFYGNTAPVYASGLLANRLVNHPDGVALYEESILGLLDTAWDEDRHHQRSDVMASLIQDIEPADAAENREWVLELIDNRRDEIEGAEFSWPWGMRDSFCFVEFGNADLTFATDWGSLLVQDPFSYGDSAIALDFDDGNPLDVDGTAVVGESEGAAIFYFPTWISQTEAILVYVSTSPDNIRPGSFPVDLGESIGAVFYLDTQTMEDFEFQAYITGTMTLDEAETDAGAPVTGSFDGQLLSWG